MSKPVYRECQLIQDGHKATAWLTWDKAVVGQTTTIPEVSGVWTITEVGRAKDGVQLRALAADQAPLPRPRIELATTQVPA